MFLLSIGDHLYPVASCTVAYMMAGMWVLLLHSAMGKPLTKEVACCIARQIRVNKVQF